MTELPRLLTALLARPVFAAPPSPDPAFEAALALNVAELRRRFPEYDRFQERSPSLRALFLPVLKGADLVSRGADAALWIHSSGTSGKPVAIPLDALSLEQRVLLMRAAYGAMGFADCFEEAFCFLLDPAKSALAGSQITARALQGYRACRRTRFVAERDAKGLSLDAAALRDLFTAKREKPVLVLGYPALIAHAIALAKRDGIVPRVLPAGSAVLTGGGWKSFLPGVSVEPGPFRALVGEIFRVEPGNVRDMFGLTECPVVFVDCESRHFHIPSFCRVEIVDPLTQREVAEGEIGLLKITSPFSTSFPLAAIVTTDKASRGSRCPCGRPADYFVPRGRSRAATFETCAMKMGPALEEETS